LSFALAQRARRKNEKEKGADMRKLIILMAALAVAAAVQTSSRAIAQTAPASKDAGSTTTLTAEQKKKPVVQSAPVRTIARPTTKSVSHPTTKSFSRPTTKSVSHPTSTTRSVTTRSSAGKTAVTGGKTGKTAVTSTKTGKTSVTSTKTGKTGLTQGPVGKTGKTSVTSTKTGKTGLTQGPVGKTGKTSVTSTKTGKTGLTQGPGKLGKTGKTNLSQGPGKLGKTGKTNLSQGPGKLGKTGKTNLSQGPSKLGKTGLTKGTRDGKFAKTDGRRRIGINRDRRRIFVNNRWRTLIPLIALGTFMYEDETYYADGYVSMAEPGCTGYAEDGSRLRWMAVPTEDGGTEYQCVSYSTQRNRTVTEIVVPEEPMAEAPPVAEPETVGVGLANEPAGASPPPAAPATGCELLIYSEANFKGLSAPVDENQSSLSEDGWQNEIASVQIKSGTWDFYSDEDYAGEMMRLSAGSYPTLDPKWTKHIGSFMCSAPAK
jgi:hypothetical protein